MKTRPYAIVLSALITIFILQSCGCNRKGADVSNSTVISEIKYLVTIDKPKDDISGIHGEMEPAVKKNLVDGILNGIYSGKLKAYLDESFQRALSNDEIEANSYIRFSKLEFTEDETYLAMDSVKIGTDNIFGLYFLEEWSLDPASQDISKKVKGYCPVYYKFRYDSLDTKILSDAPNQFFWIKSK
ncbi:MAG: hypothetical protein KKA07_15145 [Bacteroidetes bacterium]|nr:hypothetical protein [Bacteroidota bacterium]MBU1720397.1 hypothetical protein [Bacteroidota bacterium]